MRLSHLLIFAMAMMCQAIALAQTPINTSFEEYTDGSVYGQDDWLKTSSTSGAAEIVTDPVYAHTGSKGIKLYSATSVGTGADYLSYSKDETGISGNVYVDLWVKTVTTPGTMYIRVYDFLPSNSSKRAVELRMKSDGTLNVNSSSSLSITNVNYTIGTWTRVSFAIDFATSTYQVAVNGNVMPTAYDFRESYSSGRDAGVKEYHYLRVQYDAAIADVAIDDVYVGTTAIAGIPFVAPAEDRTITVTQPAKATITLDPQQATYLDDDVVTATVSNITEHYKFAGWTGSFSGTDNPLTITVAANVTLGASIIVDPANPPAEYTINVIQPAGGTITVSPSTGPYYDGATVQFSVTPGIGYTFDSWSGITGSGTSVQVVMSENLNVSANMILGTFTKRTVNVSTRAQLETAVENMLPGDSIVLADGTYDVFDESMTNLGGTADYPVYIIAANQGMAKITGKSIFRMDNCAYINIMGLDIEMVDKSNIFKLTDCNNIRISRNTVSSLNTTNTTVTSSKWIEIVGVWDAESTTSHHNRIDHNVFEDKLDAGALLVIGGNSGENFNTASISTYDRIDHNHFKNVGPRQTNEKETIRVGYSKLSMESAYTTIEYNLFEDCDGDPEIISVKSCDNYIRNNTFLRSLGTVSLRHGNRNEVSGNFFIGDSKTAIFEAQTIGCGGVRVYGKDHKIFNNYFEGLTGDTWDAACTLTQGDATNVSTASGSNLDAHAVIENLEFTHNTLVNNASDIEIGYRSDWGKKPINVLIANNIIVQNTNPVTKVHFANTETGVSFADNIIYTTGTGSFGDIAFTSGQATNVDPLLVLSDCKVPTGGCTGAYANAIYKISDGASPAVDPTPANTIAQAIKDIEGQSSIGSRDIGADEYNGNAPIFNGLLSDIHVGPDAVTFLTADPDGPNVWNGTAWSDGFAPTGDDDAVISGDYDMSVDGAFVVNNLDIDQGATLTVDGTNTLIVNGDLHNAGALMVASGASLITYDFNNTTGNDLVFLRNTRYADGKYSFVGTPVEQNAATTGATLGSAVYRYDESQPYATNDGLDRWIAAGADELVPGTGYTQAFQEVITFTGKPNTGTIVHAGGYTEDVDDANEGWNLVSNPYPAALFIDHFLDQNTNIAGAVYIWDDVNSENARGSNSDYIVANKIGATDNSGTDNEARFNFHLGSSQAFFVKLLSDEDQAISFKENMRVSGNNEDGSFFRKAAENIPLVRLNLTDSEGLFKQTIIGWAEDATADKIHRAYDAPVFNANSANSLYSIKLASKLAIQGVTDAQVAIDLGFSVDHAANYQLSSVLEHVADRPLWLNDRLTEQIFDLSEGAYSFSSEAGSFADRFVLLTENKAVLANAQLSKDWKVYAYKNVLHISPLADGTSRTYSMHDLSGKLMMKTLVNQAVEIELSGFKSGVYLISDGITVTKIIVE